MKDMTFYTIESASPNTIHEIITKCDEAFVEPISKADYYPALLEKISKFAIVTVAKNDDDLLGYAAFYANDKTTCIAYLTLIGVRPKCQKQGVGKKLLMQVEQISQFKGMARINLEVKKSNDVAIEFYERQGYRYLKDCSNNSIYMTKSLSSKE